MLEQDSNLVVNANRPHLNSATDTIYSMVGIQNKMQTLADRTILFGEVRGDLVEVNDYADSDLRDIALFQVTDDNRYNSPRDYYAVINNCNYFIANADTALRNNRNELIFMREYAAAKAYRAWTYFQLALVYGQVPFVTEPLLTMEVDESSFPRYDLSQICQYFINDLAPYADLDLPAYGKIGNVDSKLTYFPINVLLGELNLWAGNYREAALSYYRYLSSRNGKHTAWPLGSLCAQWTRDDGKFQRYTDSWSLQSFYESAEQFSQTGELVTMIPGDSIPTSAYYSSLRDLFTTTTLNDGYYSLSPSQALVDLSAQQVYCNKTTTGEVNYAPNNLENYRTGDLRLSSVWHTYNYNYGGLLSSTAGRPITQILDKYTTTNVHLWRRATIYLHMAEALNRAGFPQFAFRILSTGVNNNVIRELQHHYSADSLWLQQFDFPNADYILRTERASAFTTLGLHSRGSGFTEVNEYYLMPEGTLDQQMEAIEDLIVNESALELAFEGQRFYDLMRVAFRRNAPAYLASHIQARQGKEAVCAVRADLNNPQNWYLRWKGKIGY